MKGLTESKTDYTVIEYYYKYGYADQEKDAKTTCSLNFPRRNHAKFYADSGTTVHMTTDTGKQQ